MLNYNLCLALKKAGFPQSVEGTAIPTYFYNDRVTIWRETPFADSSLLTNDHTKVPTLSELIEACEGWFKGGVSLSVDDHSYDRGLYFYPYLEPKWAVFQKSQVLEDMEHIAEGNTPEEAVANLYLALHGGKRPN